MPKKTTIHSFSAQIEIIGINPFVHLPVEILHAIFEKAGKHKGPVPVKGTVNQKPFTQTLMRYAGEWRLYINTTMLKNSPGRIGEVIDITIAYDPADRTIPMHPKLQAALRENPPAKKVFDKLPPSRQKEIVRYIAHLKSEASVDKNITRAIQFLRGNERFVGRDKP